MFRREGKSCIVNASREQFTAMLRYEKGDATALGYELSVLTPRDGSFREEFLVKIYTIPAEQPLTISLYEDLLVTYAEDAKTIPVEFQRMTTEVLHAWFAEERLVNWNNPNAVIPQ